MQVASSQDCRLLHCSPAPRALSAATPRPSALRAALPAATAALLSHLATYLLFLLCAGAPMSRTLNITTTAKVKQLAKPTRCIKLQTKLGPDGRGYVDADGGA